MIEFQGFGKIPRLFRDIVITEKIDGTNAAIGIVSLDDLKTYASTEKSVLVDGYHVYAQSRKRLIYPGQDNHGFARWAWENARSLVNDLGPGLHFGEWWGSGINRGYGLPKGEKRFSLFNVKRWTDAKPQFRTPNLDVVPILYRGPFNTETVRDVMEDLRDMGSEAAPGFMNPEGVVVYHTAGNHLFKSTILNDEAPKSLAS